MTQRYQLRDKIFLIGNTQSQIIGNKLPTKHQVLKTLLFNTRHLQMSLRDSASLVIKEVTIFWQKAKIPTQYESRCIEKLENLYGDLRALQKNRGKQFNKPKEEQYLSKLSTLFDIAHGNVLQMIGEDKKSFLYDQRSERRNYIEGFSSDTDYYELSDSCNNGEYHSNNIAMNKAESLEISSNIISEGTSNSNENNVLLEEQPVDSEIPEIRQTDENCEMESSEQFSSSQGSGSSSYLEKGRYYLKKNCRGTVNIMSESVVEVLDNCKVSYRNSVRIIAAICETIGYNANDLILNKSSFHISRQKIREKKADKIKVLFGESKINGAIIHWDGKIIPDTLSSKQIDRLPIIVSYGKTQKMLSVPALSNGKGVTQAEAIYKVLSDWGLTESIVALCCDTTNSNLGCTNGAAVILEQMLEINLLYLPCRHHIFELIVGSVFNTKLPGMNGPNVPLFQRFRKSWNDINKSNYKNGLHGKKIDETIRCQINDIVCFIKQLLNEIQPRDDYKELLLLSQIFLGLDSSTEVKFYKPGAVHHARWMSKAIYSLKIYIFRECFKLTKSEEKGLFDVCMFIIFVYLKAWYTSSLAIKAPNHDLNFIKILFAYKSVDVQAAEVALSKFKNHLWYLSPEICAISFFDNEVSVEVKRKMVKALQISRNFENDPPKRFYIHSDTDMKNLCDKDLDFFINESTWRFFKSFKINTTFFQFDVEMWSAQDAFLEGLEIVKNLTVVNDVAERNVHLAEQYMNVLTKDENQKQYLLQVITEYKKNFPNANKGTVLKKIKRSP